LSLANEPLAVAYRRGLDKEMIADKRLKISLKRLRSLDLETLMNDLLAFVG